MDSKSTSYETAINVSETESTKQKSSAAAAAAAAPAAAATVATTKAIPHNQKGGWRRGVAIFDFILRLCALVAALAAATTMATSEESLTLFTQFFQFEASYDDLPALSYFVVANAIASAYLVLSLPFSIVGIVRPHLVGVKLLLSILDTVMVAFTTAAAAAATAIVYLAHYGNPTTQWRAICQQFGDFCQRVSGAVVASFIAAFILILLVVFSAVARRSH